MSPERFSHYKTGFDVLDIAHLNIFYKTEETINYLKSKDRSSAKISIDELKQVVVTHCATEYRFMVLVKYDYIEYHNQQHKEIIEAANNLTRMLDNTYHCSYFFVTSFEELFLNHVDYEDLKFVNWAKENGHT
jgi:hemerythrin-like metal-binding protein